MAITKLIAKIEKAEAINNLADILQVTDAVMVARGDLGVEMGPENVPALQKSIVRQANLRGIPVIVATQMLESMMKDEIPTRAEASDVANAVWDHADAVMLSGETATGKHPPLVLEMMNRIINSAEGAQFAPPSLKMGALAGGSIEPRGHHRCGLRSGSRSECPRHRGPHPDRAHRPAPLLPPGRRTHLWLQPGRARVSPFGPVVGGAPVHQTDRRDLDESIAAMEEYLLQTGAAEVGDAVVIAGPHPFSIGTPMNFVKYQQLSARGTGRG